MNKIELNLNDNDLAQLGTLINSSASETIKAEFKKATDLNDEIAYITHRVCQVLAGMSQKSVSDIEKIAADAGHQTLRYDVGLTMYQQQALKNPFQLIVEALHYSGIITVNECTALTTIKDCIQLILKKK